MSVVSKRAAFNAAKTLRLDPEYFQKRHLQDAELVDTKRDLFVTFKELCITVDASAFYPAIEGFYGQGDLPFLRVGDVDGFVDTDQCETIPSDLCLRYPTLARIEPGDIVFTKGGAIDRVGIVIQCAAVSRDLIFLKTSTLGDDWSRFLFAYFSSSFFRRALLRSSSQTAQPHLTITLVRELPILRSTPAFRSNVAHIIELALAAKAEVRKHLVKAEERLNLALGLADWAPPDPLAYVRPLSDVKNAGRWDSQFHLPKVDAYLERLSARMELCAIGSLGDVTNGEPVQYSDEGSVPIVRSGDLVDIDDDGRFLRAAQQESVFALQKGDVLISSIGFGSIGKVQVFDKPGTYGTVSEVTVIRQQKLDPYFLAAFLRSKPGQVQIDRWITGATGQLHLYPRDVKRIMVPVGDTGIEQSMRRAAEDARRTRRKAGELLEAAKRAVEIAIKEDEPAALRFLGQAGG